MTEGTAKFHDQLSSLASQSAHVAKYLEARRCGFAVVERHLRYDGSGFSARLVLSNKLVDVEIDSGEAAFLWLIFGHRFASDRIVLAAELCGGDELPLWPVPEFQAEIRFTCGVLSLTHLDVRRFELTESLRNRGVRYRLWLTVERASALRAVPDIPAVHVSIRMGKNVVYGLRGYVDSLTPFTLGADSIVEVQGSDVMYGCRNLVAGLFNAHVDPATSITLFAAWLDLSLITDAVLEIPAGLEGLESIPSPSSLAGPALRKFLHSFSDNVANQSLKHLCTVFTSALDQNADGASVLVQAFRNMALVLHNRIPVHIAVGSVRGLTGRGITCLAPNVVVAAADQLPFSLVGRETKGPLCKYWDHNAARLVTFFASPNAASTVTDGWKSLTETYDYVALTVADSGWVHADATGKTHLMSVEGRIQDAVLELDRWYHVHHLASGTAHQYYARQDKSSNELTLEAREIHALSPRLQLLMAGILKNKRRFPLLTAHLSQAINWLVRSRSSSTPSEAFLCLWIAIEYLVVPSGSESAIKGTVGPRLANLMARGDRTMRRYWQTKIDECYSLRCKLVHEATEDAESLSALAPLLRQTVIEVIWFCVLTIPTLSADAGPPTLLARHWALGDISKTAAKPESLASASKDTT